MTKQNAAKEIVAAKDRGTRLVWASYVAGQAGYILSHAGAVKLALSGFHRQLLCMDDFFNLANMIAGVYRYPLLLRLCPAVHPWLGLLLI